MSAFIFNELNFDDHEQVVFVSEPKSGLKGIIAVHNTNLGPAMGGCRMWNYASEALAVNDVLRLSRGMTYKNAVAGLPIGGGKSVIIGNPKTDKTPALFEALGEALERLGGRYITAEDVGTSPQDMAYVATKTRYVAGLGDNGDPSPYTALGCFVGAQAAVKYHLKRDSMEGLTVALQGLGHVGYDYARHLHGAGAKLVVADIDQAALERAREEFGAQIVSVDAIYDVQADIYAPARGATLNPGTLARMRRKIGRCRQQQARHRRCRRAAAAGRAVRAGLRDQRWRHHQGLLRVPEQARSRCGRPCARDQRHAGRGVCPRRPRRSPHQRGG
jgi:leucine dehydrogenase